MIGYDVGDRVIYNRERAAGVVTTKFDDYSYRVDLDKGGYRLLVLGEISKGVNA